MEKTLNLEVSSLIVGQLTEVHHALMIIEKAKTRVTNVLSVAQVEDMLTCIQEELRLWQIQKGELLRINLK